MSNAVRKTIDELLDDEMSDSKLEKLLDGVTNARGMKNFHIDNQPRATEIGCLNIQMQVNDKAPNSTLQGLVRRTGGGTSLPDSTPTVATLLVKQEVTGKVKAETMREGFRMCLIPHENKIHHHVIIDGSLKPKIHKPAPGYGMNGQKLAGAPMTTVQPPKKPVSARAAAKGKGYK